MKLDAARRLGMELGDAVDAVYAGYAVVLVAHVLRMLGESAEAVATARAALELRQMLAVESALRMQLAGALVESRRPDEAMSECMRVAAPTQARHLRGALDLDFFATTAEALARLSQKDACRALLARAEKVIARRASSIDDAARRARFLESTYAQRLRRVAATFG